MFKYEAELIRDMQIARETMHAAEKIDPTISARRMSSVFKNKMKELGWVTSKGLAGATKYSHSDKVSALETV